LETVRRGNLAVGVQTRQGVVLAVEEKQRKLQSAESVIKMFQIDDHVGAVGAGYIPDARIQVDNARVLAQSNKDTSLTPGSRWTTPASSHRATS
jgi:proteasome alpha subunit